MAKLHSIETFAVFDGPGVRTVFFLQGCPLRCAFCHNVDTQNPFGGRNITVEEIVERSRKMKPYFRNGKGGVTFSGGEPTLDGKFLLDAIRAVKAEGIHVTVDTSGVGDQKYYDEIIEEADLILLDIKHYNAIGFKNITERNISPLKKFIEAVERHNTPVWIRHVMMPKVTDSKYHMDKLCEFIAPIKDKIEKIEILPYHTMGVHKYEDLGIEYKLKDMEAMDKNVAKELEEYANDVLQSYEVKYHKVI